MEQNKEYLEELFKEEIEEGSVEITEDTIEIGTLSNSEEDIP